MHKRAGTQAYPATRVPTNTHALARTHARTRARGGGGGGGGTVSETSQSSPQLSAFEFVSASEPSFHSWTKPGPCCGLAFSGTVPLAAFALPVPSR